MKERLYDENGILKYNTVRLGRLSIHFCVPWEVADVPKEWRPPFRLHLSWRSKSPGCGYCGSPWEKCTCTKPRKTDNYVAWHFAIGRFAKRVQEGPGHRWYDWSTPATKERDRAEYARWKAESGRDSGDSPS